MTRLIDLNQNIKIGQDRFRNPAPQTPKDFCLSIIMPIYTQLSNTQVKNL